MEIHTFRWLKSKNSSYNVYIYNVLRVQLVVYCKYIGPTPKRAVLNIFKWKFTANWGEHYITYNI